MNVKGGSWESALQAASNDGRIELVQKLLDNGADDNIQGGAYTNSLMAASVQGHEKTVQLLLDRGASLTLEKNNQPSPVPTAMIGHKGALRILLNGGEPGFKMKDHCGQSAPFSQLCLEIMFSFRQWTW